MGGGGSEVGVQLHNNLFSPVVTVFPIVTSENHCWLNTSMRAHCKYILFLSSAAKTEHITYLCLIWHLL